MLIAPSEKPCCVSPLPQPHQDPFPPLTSSATGTGDGACVHSCKPLSCDRLFPVGGFHLPFRIWLLPPASCCFWRALVRVAKEFFFFLNTNKVSGHSHQLLSKRTPLPSVLRSPVAHVPARPFEAQRGDGHLRTWRGQAGALGPARVVSRGWG